MMTPDNPGPDGFFEDAQLDPMQTATGGKAAALTKKKAGFYLTLDLLERFNRKFFELKLAGCPIENKSALLEAALRYALNDLDQSENSRLLRGLAS